MRESPSLSVRLNIVSGFIVFLFAAMSFSWRRLTKATARAEASERIFVDDRQEGAARWEGPCRAASIVGAGARAGGGRCAAPRRNRRPTD